MQFGFTTERLPTMTSQTITEAIAECLDVNEPIYMYIASWDTPKAFDVNIMSIHQ